MSFQAYLDTIRARTGKGPEDFRKLAAERGLTGPTVKAGDVVAWLAQDFDLGRGHAMAIYALLKAGDGPRATPEARLEKLFAGGRASWLPFFETLLQAIRGFAPDVGVEPTAGYASLLREGAKFAIVQPTASHLDIGIKRKGVEPTARFVAAGGWNRMVTHRVRLEAGEPVDAELIAWLGAAYAEAGARPAKARSATG